MIKSIRQGRRNTMYRTRQIYIKKGHRLYGYCKEICLASSKLYNRANYVIRQYATASDRKEKGIVLTDNQKDTEEMVRRITDGTKYFPKGKWLNYGCMDYIMKITEDAAYYGLPSQANQQILKRLQRDYKSFFEAVKVWKRVPERLTGRPAMPGYKKRDSMITAVLTNQICKIKEGKYLRFPGTGEKLNIGKTEGEVYLKEVRVKPHGGSFVLDIVLEMPEPERNAENILFGMEEEELRRHLSELTENRYRVMAIDPGMNNFCAVTNNFGKRPFLVSGRRIKSENHYYNKKAAKLHSEAVRCNGKYFTKRIRRLEERRNRIIKDMMHKISRAVADTAQEQGADIVILGHNIFQKQGICLGDENNQNFVQIPFSVFAGMLRYKLEERGIAFLETEEAYTSKADFLSMDALPEYKKGEEPPERSGERIRRGIYRHKDGTISNADINGAANIMRKVFPNIKEWDRGVVDTPYALKIA